MKSALSSVKVALRNTRTYLGRQCFDAQLRYAARRQASRFSGLKAVCLFIGYPRSGHSLVGSLLNAHPNAVISHELNVLGQVRKGYSRDEILTLILRRDRWFQEEKHASNSGYSYAVPNQWQGRFSDLQVIGDKEGAGTSFALLEDPQRLSDSIERLALPYRILHVVRHPLDNISTLCRKNLRYTDGRLDKAVEVYFQLCAVNQRVLEEHGDRAHTIYLEDLVAQPKEVLAAACRFLGLSAEEDYLQACASVVFPSPRQSRAEVEWTPELLDTVRTQSAAVPFLKRYAM
jgi:hypothetical protein